MSDFNNIVGLTKNVVVSITTKYYGWTTINFVDSIKYFFKLKDLSFFKRQIICWSADVRKFNFWSSWADLEAF